MPRGGHNAKTTTDLKKSGTFRADRHGKRLEVPPSKSIPAPPEHFDAEHAASWFSFCETLQEKGILTDADSDAIEILVCAKITAQRTYAVLLKDGFLQDGRKHPLHMVYAEAVKTMRALFDQFGLTPRARMGMKIPEKKPEVESRILQMMKGGTKKVIN